MFNKRIRGFRKLYHRGTGGTVEGVVFTYEEVKTMVEMYRLLSKDNRKDFKNKRIEEVKELIRNVMN